MELNPQQYIEKWGGKIGGHIYLKDFESFDTYLPDADFLLPEQDFGLIRTNSRYDNRFGPMANRIVRGSHPNDHYGLVDVLKTVKFLKTKEDIDNAVKLVRYEANQPRVLSFNHYEGQEYDGRIRIMIAKQLMQEAGLGLSYPATRGSIIEHPHEKGTYILEVVSPSIGKAEYFDRVVIKNNEIIHSMNEGDETSVKGLDSRLVNSEDYKEILQLYELVKKSRFVSSDFSFQMEFGFTYSPEKGKARVQFFQARPFKNFEIASFKLDNANTKYLCFGITPPEGITLPLKILKSNDKKSLDDIMNCDRPFALMIESNSRAQSLDFQPRNMRAYLTMKNRANSLEHNNYRWVRKSNISIMDKYQTHKLLADERKKRIRIISDGINSYVEKIR